MGHKFAMLARVAGLLVLVSGLFSSGCDAGASSSDEGKPGNPADVGSNEDVGAEDDQGPTPVERHGQLSVSGTNLVDQDGEAVQLKGVSSMWLNWEHDGYAEDPTALRWLRNNWKLSVIRAAMGVEPEGAYLSDPEHATSQVHTIVQNAIDAGVYVIIDFHAHDAHLLEAEAVEFFSKMAETYADSPNVMYEPFNEPTMVQWPAVKKYHEAVVAAIRAYDDDAPIILGTPRWSQDVDVAAKDPVAGDNLLYTLHYYACEHRSWLRQKADIARAAGLALFVTEFGITAADGGLNGEVCVDEGQLWDDWLDLRKISWVAWKLDGCEPDASCLLMPGAPTNGGWTDQYLHGHAPFIRGRMQK